MLPPRKNLPREKLLEPLLIPGGDVLDRLDLVSLSSKPVDPNTKESKLMDPNEDGHGL